MIANFVLVILQYNTMTNKSFNNTKLDKILLNLKNN